MLILNDTYYNLLRSSSFLVIRHDIIYSLRDSNDVNILIESEVVTFKYLCIISFFMAVKRTSLRP